MTDEATGRPGESGHLVERVAALLRAEAGLAPEDVLPPPLPSLPAPPPPLPAESPPQVAPASPEPAAADPPVTLVVLRAAGLVRGGARSRASEEYRVMVGRILRLLRAGRGARATPGTPIGAPGRGNLLMVTSARPNEGKSFSALNLAASIAQNGLAEVLLVDVDGKAHALSAQLGLQDRRGLLDLAADPSLRPEAVLVRAELQGLALIPIGHSPPGVEKGVTRAVSAAIERLGRRFPQHVIILDTAPCLSTSDPSALAPLVDATAMVVEAQRTQRSEVEAALELVRACSNIILILNKIQVSQRHSFGSYYYFNEAP